MKEFTWNKFNEKVQLNLMEESRKVNVYCSYILNHHFHRWDNMTLRRLFEFFCMSHRSETQILRHLLVKQSCFFLLLQQNMYVSWKINWFDDKLFHGYLLGDRLITINGRNVESSTRQQVNSIIIWICNLISYSKISLARIFL